MAEITLIVIPQAAIFKALVWLLVWRGGPHHYQWCQILSFRVHDL